MLLSKTSQCCLLTAVLSLCFLLLPQDSLVCAWQQAAEVLQSALLNFKLRSLSLISLIIPDYREQTG
jgi:hypothetical protein